MRTQPGFLEGTQQMVGRVNGCELSYTRIQNDSSWRTAPDWTDTVRSRRAVNAIIERAEALIIRSSENGNSGSEREDLEGGSVAAREDSPLSEQSA
jgi:hypothetical protein